MERIAAVDDFPKLVDELENESTRVSTLANANAAEVKAFAKALKGPAK